MNMRVRRPARPVSLVGNAFCLSFVLLIAACCSTGSTPGVAPSDASGAIQKINERFSANVKRGDAAAVVSDFYADEAIALPPNAPAMKGAAAIRQFWTALLAAGSVDLRLTSQTVTEASSGDLASEVGEYDLTINPKGGGAAIHDVGKYVVTWRKSGGRWQALYDIFNSSAPAH